MPYTLDNDPKDRKRRFLQGLNRLLGHDKYWEEDIAISDALRVDVREFRRRLVSYYGLEFVDEEIKDMIASGITSGAFTEKYCHLIYNDRGGTDLNSLVASSSSIVSGRVELSLREMDRSLKFGLNGNEWCDVAVGPCSCGASHK